MNRILKCDKYRITTKFSSNHKGIDIVGRKDDKNITCPIKAHTSGQVVWLQTGQKNNTNLKPGTNATYGNAVKIKHSNGYYTLYAHMKEVYVKKNQKVSTGQEIGYMGNTGLSFGSHLHWEVRKPNETRINPEPYINSDLPGMAHYYQSYDNKYNRWLPKVKIGSNSYAGNVGNGISAIRVEDVTEYRVHDKVKNKWLPIVKGTSDYAGNLPNDIDAVAIKSSKYKYQIHLLKSNRWLDYVDGYNIKDSKNGYAGNIGETIDAIRIVNK